MRISSGLRLQQALVQLFSLSLSPLRGPSPVLVPRRQLCAGGAPASRVPERRCGAEALEVLCRAPEIRDGLLLQHNLAYAGQAIPGTGPLYSICWLSMKGPVILSLHQTDLGSH